MGRMIKKTDQNVRQITRFGELAEGAERTDGKRWNNVVTVRYDEMLMPEDHGLRRAERAKLGIKDKPRKSRPKPMTDEERLDLMIRRAGI